MLRSPWLVVGRQYKQPADGVLLSFLSNALGKIVLKSHRVIVGAANPPLDWTSFNGGISMTSLSFS